METELKFGIESIQTADRIWEDAYLKTLEERDSREIVPMRAVYFDTEDMALSRGGIAYRVRSEGEKTFATLKWKGEAEGALHQREEINVPFSGNAQEPGPDIFSQSEMGVRIAELVADKAFVPIICAETVRKRFRTQFRDSLMEISLDSGEISAQRKSSSINEVEIELFTGNQEDLLDLGKKIASKYDLKPEIRSKYARGLELIEEK